MNLTCAIIDDEPLAVEMMAGYVRKTPFLHLSGTYNSAVQAIKALRETPVDLLFLDIQMPELSGIEFAKVLPKSTMVVFTTAFSQYAVEGYAVDAVGSLMNMKTLEDYLPKPDFMRCHRSYIVQMSKVESLDRLRMIIRDNFIPISDSYKDAVLSYLDNHTLS